MSSHLILILPLLLVIGLSNGQDFNPLINKHHQTPPGAPGAPGAPNMGSRFGVKYDEALEAIFSVAVRLEALLSETGTKNSKNFMVSPLSMAAAIGELILGARGKLQEELYDLLVVDSTANRSESVRHISETNNSIRYHPLHEQLGDLMQNLQKRGSTGRGYSLHTASVIFRQFGLQIEEEFARNVLKFYGTQIRDVDFANDPIRTEALINQWAIDNTNGLIRSILPGPVQRHTAAILANAVYFRGDWEIPFSSEINRIGKFRVSQNEDVNVTFMMGEFENYKFVDSKKYRCRMIVIPYQDNELSMYIVLPHEDHPNKFNINKFTSDLRTRDIMELIGEVQQRKVFMILPKMKLSNTISVLGPLKKYHSYKNQIEPKKETNIVDEYDRLDDRVDLFKNITKSGLADRFTNSHLDLSGISRDSRFQISEIYQQMTLSVNEQGTEAAAVAASAIDYIADSVNVRVDRPFLFFIRHEATEASLFWGTIGDPTETSN